MFAGCCSQPGEAVGPVRLQIRAVHEDVVDRRAVEPRQHLVDERDPLGMVELDVLLLVERVVDGSHHDASL